MLYRWFGRGNKRRGDDFGLKRVQQIALDNKELSPAALNALIIKNVNLFKGDVAYPDDIALVSCRLL